MFNISISILETMINTGQRLNIAADSIYLWSIANYVIDPEICSADSAYEALIDSIPGTPTHSRLPFFFLHLCGINRLQLWAVSLK